MTSSGSGARGFRPCSPSLAVALALLGAGCGRIAFDDVAALGGDANGGGGDGGADAAIAPPFTIDLGGSPSGLRSLASLPDGRLAVAGYISSATTLGGISLGAFGGTDIVLGVVNFDGSVAWARTFGSSSDDEAWSVAAGPDGSIFVTGTLHGPVNFGGGPLVPQGYNAFVASFTADGVYRWAVRFGGDIGTGEIEGGYRIVVAANGDLLVTGRIEGPTDFGDGNVTPQVSSDSDGFVIRLRGSDGQLQWKSRWNTSAGSFGLGIAEDANGNVYATGTYAGTANFGGGTVPFRGSTDGMLISLDANGGYRWAKTFGGTGDDWTFGVDVVGQTVVAVGYYDGTVDLAVPPSNGLKDAFVATYGLDGSPGWVRAFGGPGCDLAYSVRGAGGEIVIGAMFSGTVDLGDGAHTAVDAGDGLFATLTPSGQTTWSTAFGGTGDDTAFGTAGARATGLYLLSQLGTDLDIDCTGYPLAGRGKLEHL